MDARAAADSCEVSTIAKTETGDVDDSNAAVCKIGVVSSDDEKITNGAVAIATSVSARACGKGFTTTSFEVEAEVRYHCMLMKSPVAVTHVRTVVAAVQQAQVLHKLAHQGHCHVSLQHILNEFPNAH